MATEVIMPKFGMAQEEGTVLRWLKQEGDPVEKGDVLLEVLTDKMDMEVEAQASGVLRGIRVQADETVPVATVLAYILAPGEPLPTAPEPEPSAAAAPETPVQTAAATPPKASPVAQRIAREAGVDLNQVAGSGPGGRVTRADVEAHLASAPAAEPQMGGKVRATPAARRIAREAGVDLAQVTGSGPKGRVQADDVTHYVAARTARQAEAPAPPAGQPLRGVRKTIARRLSHSWQTIPHITFTASLDMTAAESLRARLGPEVKEWTGASLTPTVLLAKAVAATLSHHPRLNAWLQPQGGDLLLTEHGSVNLGVAVALDDGLIVPVIRDAQGMGLADLAAAIADLSARARSGELHPDEVAGGTFTISNLGMYPLDHFTAIIDPPQVAILAVARAQVRPLWDGEQFTPAPIMQVTLSADHRAVDGAVAAAFLADLKAMVEEPGRMLL